MVVLGLDVLGDLALQVSVARRQVAFVPSRPKRQWQAQHPMTSLTARVLEVTRAPTHDWPLLTVRVRQGPESMISTFVFSTRDRLSRVFDQAARGQGLLPALEALRVRGLTHGQLLPSELEAFTGYPYEQLELAPGFGVSEGMLEVIDGSPPHGVAGVLAPDVWGHFEVTYDVKAGVLVFEQASDECQPMSGGTSTYRLLAPSRQSPEVEPPDP